MHTRFDGTIAVFARVCGRALEASQHLLWLQIVAKHLNLNTTHSKTFFLTFFFRLDLLFSGRHLFDSGICQNLALLIQSVPNRSHDAGHRKWPFRPEWKSRRLFTFSAVKFLLAHQTFDKRGLLVWSASRYLIAEQVKNPLDFHSGRNGHLWWPASCERFETDWISEAQFSHIPLGECVVEHVQNIQFFELKVFSFIQESPRRSKTTNRKCTFRFTSIFFRRSSLFYFFRFTSFHFPWPFLLFLSNFEFQSDFFFNRFFLFKYVNNMYSC